MGQYAKSPCRKAVFVVVVASLMLGAGCVNTMRKTFDMSPDPELNRPGVYPNINDTGAAQPGKLMTPEELAEETAALQARGQQASPAAGAAAKQAGAERAEQLGTLAKNHGDETLKEIANGCGTDRVIDATKCPQ